MLFNGEKFVYKKNDYTFISKNTIDDRYKNEEIRIITEQARYPLPTIGNLFDNDKYIIHPDYQRNRRWDDKKRSKLIESFIINIPIPPIFLYETDYARFELMDGLQRITTIIDFYNDRFELKGLEIWSDLNGMKYSKLPDTIKQGIDRRYISSLILLKESSKNEDQADNLKKLVFERLNTGGVQLSKQEIRNALYQGKLNNLCADLAENKTFKLLWETDNEYITNDTFNDSFNNKLSFDMSDREIVLKFFAFRFIEQYKGSLNSFLDNFLCNGNKYKDSIINEYKELFVRTIELANCLFGQYAFKKFYKYNDGTWFWSRPEKFIYDPIMQVISKYNKNDFSFTEKSKKEFIASLESLYRENEGSFNGKKQSKDDIITRMNLYDNLLKKYKK